MGFESTAKTAPLCDSCSSDAELYHYTSLQNVFLVLKDSPAGPEVCFWASDIGFQNDASERLSLLKEPGNKKALTQSIIKCLEDENPNSKGLIEQISQLVEERKIPCACFNNDQLLEDLNTGVWAKAFLKDFIQRIEQDESKVYTVSFSATKDDINQWTRYGGNGCGVAVGFNPLELKKRIHGRRATFAKCDYLKHLPTKKDYKRYTDCDRDDKDSNSVACYTSNDRSKNKQNHSFVAQSLILFFFRSVKGYLELWQKKVEDSKEDDSKLKEQFSHCFPNSNDQEQADMYNFLCKGDCINLVEELKKEINNIQQKQQKEGKKFESYGHLDPCILSGLLKNDHFESEQEWRLLKEHNSHFSGCQYRATAFGLVPYIPFHLGSARGLVTSLWLGPTANVNSSRQALERWCRQHEFDVNMIKTSNIPYRPS